VDLADNIDLLHIVQDWEDSHETKYGCRPKLVRNLVDKVQC
jgi:katanin p60 ATPase-containing subunit A1